GERRQHGRGSALGIEQTLAEHVAPRALLRAVGNVRRELRRRLLRAQRRFVNRECGDRNVYLEAAVVDRGWHIDRATQVAGRDDVVVPGARERATPLDENGEERSL